jgi:hypothetical protein
MLKKFMAIKKISTSRAILYVTFFLLFICINFFIKPYPEELTTLDIVTDVDNDAVLAAFMFNCFLLLVLVTIWIYTMRKGFHQDLFLIILTVFNIIMIFYWGKYL